MTRIILSLYLSLYLKISSFILIFEFQPRQITLFSNLDFSKIKDAHQYPQVQFLILINLMLDLLFGHELS